MDLQDKDETQRLIRVLTTAMRILGLSNREIEKRLQLSPSYLSRLFNGLIELRVEHLLAISRAIGLKPAEFFHLAYPKRSEPPSEAALQLRRALQELQPPTPPPPSPLLREDEIERKIQETVQRLLAESGRLPQS
jgi:transcriptional regulator with XRE-family HTH domain